MHEHADTIAAAHRILAATEARVVACYTHPLMAGRRAEQARRERADAAACAHNIRADARPWFVEHFTDGGTSYQRIAAAAIDGCSGAYPAFGADELPGGASWHTGRARDLGRRSWHFDHAADRIIARRIHPGQDEQAAAAVRAYEATTKARWQHHDECRKIWDRTRPTGTLRS